MNWMQLASYLERDDRIVRIVRVMQQQIAVVEHGSQILVRQIGEDIDRLVRRLTQRLEPG